MFGGWFVTEHEDVVSVATAEVNGDREDNAEREVARGRRALDELVEGIRRRYEGSPSPGMHRLPTSAAWMPAPGRGRLDGGGMKP